MPTKRRTGTSHRLDLTRNHSAAFLMGVVNIEPQKINDYACVLSKRKTLTLENGTVGNSVLVGKAGTIF